MMTTTKKIKIRICWVYMIEFHMEGFLNYNSMWNIITVGLIVEPGTGLWHLPALKCPDLASTCTGPTPKSHPAGIRQSQILTNFKLDGIRQKMTDDLLNIAS